MRIVLVSSEAVPFSKTGGLGDVSCALAKALGQMGHQVWLVIPYYGRVYHDRGLPQPEFSGLSFDIPLWNRPVKAGIFFSGLPEGKDRKDPRESNVVVLHIDQPEFFNRDGLYGTGGSGGGDYEDNAERFAFFSRAAIEAVRRMVVRPHVLHANDWQTGLIPALLATRYRTVPGLRSTVSIFTIHNLLFQGRFEAAAMNYTGMGWKYFNWEQMEAYEQLNLLKTGLVFADRITTVSPSYAEEIQTPGYGNGLEGVLKNRTADLVGILNGIDTVEWNPSTDPYLTDHFNVESARDGKAANKRSLQRELGLAQRNDVPLVTMISRLTGQKGLDQLLGARESLAARDIQFAFLGTGERNYEHALRNWANESPQKVAAVIGFREDLAHRLEAAADMYLMPSTFEPCGLNQMYSMRYGTVPVVRRVGGLGDSVTNVSPQALAEGTATGFTFAGGESRTLLQSLCRAESYFRMPEVWSRIVTNGMTRDWSWSKSAVQYLQVYRQALGWLD